MVAGSVLYSSLRLGQLGCARVDDPDMLPVADGDDICFCGIIQKLPCFSPVQDMNMVQVYNILISSETLAQATHFDRQ